MMKKCTFLLLTLCVLTLQLNAQVVFATARELSILSKNIERAVAKGKALYIPGKTTAGKALDIPTQTTGKAELSSFQRTLRTWQAQRKSFSLAQRAAKQWEGRGAELVPSLPFCKTQLLDRQAILTAYAHFSPDLTDTQLCHLLTTEENILFTQEVERNATEIFPHVQRLLPRFRQRVAETSRPQDPLQYAVEHIPAQVNTLYLTETHEFEEVQYAVAQFLKKLRAARPHQSIILLTEFLPQYYLLEEAAQLAEKDTPVDKILPSYREVFAAALEANIPVIGLEPLPVFERKNHVALMQPDWGWGTSKEIKKILSRQVFESLNGMVYRNREFLQTLQQERRLYPDSLFVVYTGTVHSSYKKLASLADSTPADQSFVLTLGIGKSLLEEDADTFYGRIIRSTSLKVRTQLREEFDHSFLDFSNDKELATYAGFDMYIEIEK